MISAACIRIATFRYESVKTVPHPVSGRQHQSGSRGRVYTASTSSIAATNALFAFGGMTQHCRRCGLREFF
jgi:hypothetical protein